MTTQDQFTTPAGRIVQGDPWKLPQKLDFTTKQPKLNKEGQFIYERFVALAIPKTDPTWNAFWARLTTVGVTGYGGQIPGNMAWKVTDGDAPEHAAKVGFLGHWIVAMSTQFETKIVDRDGNPLTEESQCKRGDYADIFIDVRADGHAVNPSIYISPKIIRVLGYGEPIIGGPDVSDMDAAPVAPAGASPVPVGGAPMALTAPVPAPVPALPVAGAPVPAPVTVAPVGAVPAVPVAPVAGVPAVPLAPAPVQSVAPLVPTPAPVLPSAPLVPAAAISSPSSPPAPTAPVMTAKAVGVTREAYHASGWTDEQLIAEGYMIAPHTAFVNGPTV